MDPELIVLSGDSVSESPRWDPATRSLLWIDADAPRGHRLRDRRADLRALDETVTSIALGERGRGAATASDGVRELHHEDGMRLGGVLHVYPPVAPGTVVNDSGVDPTGRLVVGFGSEEERGRGCLIGIDLAEGRDARLADGLSFPNGIGWSPDGTRMYVADSYENVVLAYPYDAHDGTAGTPSVLFRTDQGEMPDGLAVDADGAIWIALWGGGAVIRVDAAGRLLSRVALPASQVSSCAFGGAALEDLYITTARLGKDEPLAGGLFVLPRAGRGRQPASVRL